MSDISDMEPEKSDQDSDVPSDDDDPNQVVDENAAEFDEDGEGTTNPPLQRRPILRMMSRPIRRAIKRKKQSSRRPSTEARPRANVSSTTCVQRRPSSRSMNVHA
jgi:hypothetical protein